VQLHFRLDKISYGNSAKRLPWGRERFHFHQSCSYKIGSSDFGMGKT
jgi:hypothetical protein